MLTHSKRSYNWNKTSNLTPPSMIQRRITTLTQMEIVIAISVYISKEVASIQPKESHLQLRWIYLDHWKKKSNWMIRFLTTGQNSNPNRMMIRERGRLKMNNLRLWISSDITYF